MWLILRASHLAGVDRRSSEWVTLKREAAPCSEAGVVVVVGGCRREDANSITRIQALAQVSGSLQTHPNFGG